MKYLVSLFSVLFFVSCNEQALSTPPIVTVHENVKQLANAQLPNYQYVWHKSVYKSSIVLEADYVSQKPLISVKNEGWLSQTYLHIFNIIKVEEGKFKPDKLKFISIFNAKDGVKYKRLILRGRLKFWLNETPNGFEITNIESL